MVVFNPFKPGTRQQYASQAQQYAAQTQQYAAEKAKDLAAAAEKAKYAAAEKAKYAAKDLATEKAKSVASSWIQKQTEALAAKNEQIRKDQALAAKNELIRKDQADAAAKLKEAQNPLIIESEKKDEIFQANANTAMKKEEEMKKKEEEMKKKEEEKKKWQEDMQENLRIAEKVGAEAKLKEAQNPPIIESEAEMKEKKRLFELWLENRPPAGGKIKKLQTKKRKTKVNRHRTKVNRHRTKSLSKR